MANAIGEMIESVEDSKAREIHRNHEMRIKALEEGIVAEITTPSIDWTKAQLLEEAEKRGLAIGSHATKEEILDLLKT